jgi:hypothetical protein
MPSFKRPWLPREESGFYALLYEKASWSRERKRDSHEAAGKLSAKMLLIAWTLMKKKEAFDPAYLKAE